MANELRRSANKKIFIPAEMSKLELKSFPLSLELKDVDKSKRTAVLAHACYNTVDRSKDVIRRGAFAKTWNENKSDIAYYLNHDDNQSPGVITNLFDDEEKAYTEVKNGTHTLGNDVNIMMDEGVIKNVSFGYIVTKANKIETKSGSKVREIKELYHGETSVLTKLQCNPGAKVMSHTKAFDFIPNLGNLEFKTLSDAEQNFLTTIINAGQSGLQAALNLANVLTPDSDLYTYINWYISRTADQMSDLKSQLKYGRKSFEGMKEHLETMEKFVRNTTASDECIQLIQKEVEEYKSLLSDSNDTADTLEAGEPSVSIDEDLVLAKLKLLSISNF